MDATKLDNAIEESIKCLHRTEKGEAVAAQLKELFTGPASGLDSAGQNALAVLTLAFTKEGRREFALDL